MSQKKTLEMGIVVSAVFWTFLVMAPDVLQSVAHPIRDYVATSRYGALPRAVVHNNIKMVRLLLEKGADPNIETKNGVPLLTNAVARGNIDITRLLLDRGADPNKRYQLGSTLLLNAVGEGKIGIINLLLKSGADPNLKGKNGETALMIVVHGKNYVYGDAAAKYIVELLVKNGANLKAKDKDGKSVMEWAARSTMKLLLVRLSAGEGESPEKIKVWKKGMTVSMVDLVHSIRRNDLESVKLLLKAGVDVSKNESTPLIEAIMKRNPQIIEILLKNGADVNAKKEGGWTTLMEASIRGYKNIVELLLDNGANVNYRNNEHKTALTYVKKGSYRRGKASIRGGEDK